MTDNEKPLEDLIAESVRVIEAARAAQVAIRLTGERDAPVPFAVGR